MKICISCGARSEEAQNFCSNCGGSAFKPQEAASPANAPKLKTPPPLYAPQRPISGATPPVYINPGKTPPAASSAAGNTLPGTVSGRILLVASSGPSEALKMISTFQFVLMLVLLVSACILLINSVVFKPFAGIAIILLLPYLMLFIEGRLTYSAAAKSKESLASLGIVFGAIGNVINTVYSGAFFSMLLALMYYGNTFIIRIRNTVISYFPSEIAALLVKAINSFLRTSGLQSAIRTGMMIILSIPLAASLIWFVTCIMIDIAHIRTAAAIKSDSLKKPPVTLPITGLLAAALLSLILFLVLLIASPAAITALMAAVNPLAAFLYICVVSLSALGAAGCFVKAILFIRLSSCFK